MQGVSDNTIYIGQSILNGETVDTFKNKGKENNRLTSEDIASYLVIAALGGGVPVVLHIFLCIIEAIIDCCSNQRQIEENAISSYQQISNALINNAAKLVNDEEQIPQLKENSVSMIDLDVPGSKEDDVSGQEAVPRKQSPKKPILRETTSLIDQDNDYDNRTFQDKNDDVSITRNGGIITITIPVFIDDQRRLFILEQKSHGGTEQITCGFQGKRQFTEKKTFKELCIELIVNSNNPKNLNALFDIMKTPEEISTKTWSFILFGNTSKEEAPVINKELAKLYGIYIDFLKTRNLSNHQNQDELITAVMAYLLAHPEVKEVLEEIFPVDEELRESINEKMLRYVDFCDKAVDRFLRRKPKNISEVVKNELVQQYAVASSAIGVFGSSELCASRRKFNFFSNPVTPNLV